MASKQKKLKKKEKTSSKPIELITRESKGFLLLSFSILLFLSLLSYAIDPQAKNLLGLMGHTFGWTLHALLGLSSYLFVLYLGWISWRLLFSKPLNVLWLKNLYVIIAISSFCLLLSLIENDFPSFSQLIGNTFYPGLWKQHLKYHLGGALFFYIYKDIPSFNLHHIFNTVGASLIFSSTFIASIIFLFKIRLDYLYSKCIEAIKSGIARERAQRELWKASKEAQIQEKQLLEEKSIEPQNKAKNEPESDFLRFVKLRIPTNLEESQIKPTSAQVPSDMLAIHPEKNLKNRPSISRKEQDDEEAETQILKNNPIIPQKKNDNILSMIQEDGREAFKQPSDHIQQQDFEKIKKREAALAAQIVHNGDFTNYVLPPLSLLTSPKIVDQTSIKKDLKRQAEVLEETLLSFGIEAKVGQINCGPTITSFEVHPAIGVKVQKIKSLDNDIALNMEAKSIRIIAPIPGKAAVGIEVPNSQPQEVSFKDTLLAYQQRPQKFNVPILLGKAVNGDYVMSDLTKMPHCIIAGATGSGKSVCINTIVMSIVLNCKPD
ncbi:MAG: DNA translocase FtsK 4TM domain-containing protein, partial [Parachlamydiaceae bacterium]|nr:DNA translocase FtsK 4TM domain-containing protein [Parachlamydiaceae bacterium]